MIAKLKEYANYAWAALVGIIVGTVYYLSQKNSSLESKNAELKGKLNGKEDEVKLDAQKHAADSAEANYNDVKSKYLSQSDDSSGSGEGEL